MDKDRDKDMRQKTTGTQRLEKQEGEHTAGWYPSFFFRWKTPVFIDSSWTSHHRARKVLGLGEGRFRMRWST